MPDTTFASHLEAEHADQRGRAARALLARPMIDATSNAATFDLIRRHHAFLAGWFQSHCGWNVDIDLRAGWARLLKTTQRPDATRPARRTRGARHPFDRRRYVLLCLTGSELARPGVQTTIGRLADHVRTLSQTLEHIESYNPDRRSERSAFVDVIKFYEQVGVLQVVQGDAGTYSDSADAKVLLRVDTNRLGRLLTDTVSPSRIGGLAPELTTLIADLRYGDPTRPEAITDEQRRRRARHSLYRRLVDDPVVYFHDLDDDELGYWQSQKTRIVAALDELGLRLEQRAEGLLTLDVTGQTTDTRFPDENSIAKHAALVLLDLFPGINRAARDGSPAVTGPPVVSRASATRMLADLLEHFPTWARTYQTDGGPDLLLNDALEVLAGFGLVHATPTAVISLPAAARYASLRVSDLTTNPDDVKDIS